jgi:two-component system KDP operon response regulator KdpE
MGEGNRTRTILLVDDDDEVRTALRRGLERGGFRVVAAFDERDGAERAARDAPDLILLELGRVLPGDALAAGRRIRRGVGLAEEVPLVAYANNASEVAREGEAVEFRPGEFVVLPEDTEQLTGWLRGLTG